MKGRWHRGWRWFCGGCALVCLGVLCLAGACTTATCEGDLSDLTLDPANSPCKARCECNNRYYTGYCVQGVCKSIARGACTAQGKINLCKNFHLGCSGEETCLSTGKWSDCVCDNQKEGQSKEQSSPEASSEPGAEAHSAEKPTGSDAREQPTGQDAGGSEAQGEQAPRDAAPGDQAAQEGQPSEVGSPEKGGGLALGVYCDGVGPCRAGLKCAVYCVIACKTSKDCEDDCRKNDDCKTPSGGLPAQIGVMSCDTSRELCVVGCKEDAECHKRHYCEKSGGSEGYCAPN